MLVSRGSLNFTSRPKVLIAPRAPIDPDCTMTLQARWFYPTRPAEVRYEVISLRLENQQKGATAVDPLLFHALTFHQQIGCFEHSDLLTVTSVGVPCGAYHSESGFHRQ